MEEPELYDRPLWSERERTMKRKLMPILMAALILALSIVPQVTHAEACAHENLLGDQYYEECVPFTNSQHKVKHYKYNVCALCHENVNIRLYETTYEGHNVSRYISNLGHVTGTATHEYRARCGKCAAAYNRLVPCSGPPCITPYGHTGTPATE